MFYSKLKGRDFQPLICSLNTPGHLNNKLGVNLDFAELLATQQWILFLKVNVLQSLLQSKVEQLSYYDIQFQIHSMVGQFSLFKIVCSDYLKVKKNLKKVWVWIQLIGFLNALFVSSFEKTGLFWITIFSTVCMNVWRCKKIFFV